MSVVTSITRTLWLAVLASALISGAFLGCDDPGELWPDDDDAADDDDAVGDDDVADDDDDDDDVTFDPFRIAGELTIEPVYYILDEEDVWSRQELEWTDINPDGYPYGLAYIGITRGFDDTSTPLLHFIPPEMPVDPKNEGIPYEFSPVTWDVETAYVMATADTYHDGIISYWDNMAFYNEGLNTSGPPVEDANIVMDVEFVWNGTSWGRGCHLCGGGGWTGDPVVISGTVELNIHQHPEAVGDSLVAVYAHNAGPYWTYRPGELRGDQPNEQLGWEMTVYDNFAATIYGVWDWNNNGLFEPSDDWGASVDAIGGNQINPWSVGDDPITNITVEVPREECSPAMPRPYVSVMGDVVTDGTFEFTDLLPTARLYILGARHHLSHIEDSEIQALFDIGKAWSFVEIMNVDAAESHQYHLFVAAYQSTVIYALLDEDGDGFIETGYELDGIGGVVHLDVTTANVDLDLTMTYDP